MMGRFRLGFGLGALDKIGTRSGRDPDEIQTRSEKSFVQTLPNRLLEDLPGREAWKRTTQKLDKDDKEDKTGKKRQ